MFNVKSVEETKRIIRSSFLDFNPKSTSIDVASAKGYIISEDVYSSEDVPQFNRSTVDGYAVISKVVAQASTGSPIPLRKIGESIMGKACTLEVSETSCVYVPTGGHIPKGADSVVMIEQAEKMNDEILIQKGVSPFENILLKGSDMKNGELVVRKGTKIKDTTIGIFKALGIDFVEVYQPLKTVLISTGDEITSNKEIQLGEIRDINTFTISSYLDDFPINITKKIVIQDDFEAYKNEVIEAFRTNDFVIASGGSSVGEKDYTIRILKELHAEILIHGVSIKPGKPTIVGKVQNKPFFGLPGNPTSAYVVLREFFDQFMSSIFGVDTIESKPYLEGVLTKNVFATQGRKLYQIVKVDEKEKIEVTPLYAKSGMIKLLSESYGYIVLEDDQEGLVPGEVVKVYRWGD